MKHILKTAIISSLLVITCLLIGACGNSTENFVQGNGKIKVTVKDNAGALLSGVKIEVKADSVGGKLVSSWTTDSTGYHEFQETIGTDYYLTFNDTNNPAKYATQNYVNKVSPDLTNPQSVNVTMVLL